MKEILSRMVQGSPAPAAALNRVREYLQARILSAVGRAGGMIALGFCGGTALRFLYDLPRYSEDLDFTLHRKNKGFELRKAVLAVRGELEAENYEVGLKISTARAVQAALIKLPGLMYELGLSGHRRQALSVRVEVDTAPPAGVRCETSLVRRHLTLRLQHHDRASLLAGKLHAVLMRPYVKGRDLHDLLWYLADPGWPPPNLELLNNALEQTGWQGARLEPANWAAAVSERLAGIDFKHAVEDVRPFLEPGTDAGLIPRDNLEQLLKKRR